MQDITRSLKYLIYLFTISFTGIAGAEAGFKVLLCSEDLKHQDTAGCEISIYPGDDIEASGQILASTYPAYIAVYDYNGHFWENNIEGPLELKNLNAELRNSRHCNYGTQLIKKSLEVSNRMKKDKRNLESQKEYRYKSLSHQPRQGLMRCPAPLNEVAGATRSKVERKTYSLYIFSRSEKGLAHCTVTLQNFFNEPVHAMNCDNCNRKQSLFVNLNDAIFDREEYILKVENADTAFCDCSSGSCKLLIFMTEEESRLKNTSVKLLRAEFPDSTSLLASYLLALVYEDHEMYFDSVHLYISIYKSVSGKDERFNDYLYKYLLTSYLAASIEN